MAVALTTYLTFTLHTLIHGSNGKSRDIGRESISILINLSLMETRENLWGFRVVRVLVHILIRGRSFKGTGSLGTGRVIETTWQLCHFRSIRTHNRR